MTLPNFACKDSKKLTENQKKSLKSSFFFDFFIFLVKNAVYVKKKSYLCSRKFLGVSQILRLPEWWNGRHEGLKIP